MGIGRVQTKATRYKKVLHLLVNPVLLVGRVDEDIRVLLARGPVGHVDVDSARGHALGDAVGVERLGLEGRVAHEKGASGHVGHDIRVGVAV